MKQLTPHINFDGNCREAMTYYQVAFGGQLHFTTVGESPMAQSSPPESANKIIHAALMADGLRLLASDMGGPAAASGLVSIIADCSSQAELDKAFKVLSHGGNVICPVGPAFWGGKFGVTNDKFGVTWMLYLEDGH